MKKLYIIAGERSGDLHGSNLVKSLRRRDPSLQIRGFGGDEMQRAGVDIFVHYERLAFMGFIALITNVRTIFRYIAMAKEDIRQFKPDAIILIDYGGFNRRIAKFGRLAGINVIYYIPPKVWAWYQRRAFELKQNVNRLLVILPFEKKFYKEKCNWEVDYVGNPVLDAIKSFTPDPTFAAQHQLDSSKKIVALLPGSRKMELKRIVPLMSELVKRNQNIQFIVAAVGNLSVELYGDLPSQPNVKLITDASYDILSRAHAAIVTSGTATLETSIFKVPQVVVYKTSTFEYAVAKRVISVPFISLVNLIADHEVVKELIQDAASLTAVQAELDALLQEGSYRANMLNKYETIYRILDTGSASDNAAAIILA